MADETKVTQAVIVMYDAPQGLDEWMHGPHYREVLDTPGVTGVRRYQVLAGPDDCRKYLAVIETNDLDATLAWRDSEQGKRSQEEANKLGVSNRYSLICKQVY